MNTPTVDKIWKALNNIESYFIEDDEVPLDCELHTKLNRVSGVWKYTLILDAKGDGGVTFKHQTEEYFSLDDAILEFGKHFDDQGFYHGKLSQCETPFKIGPS